MPKIRTRFAPSPTGFLHIGGLRIVLFDYLIAKSLGGKIILRIEDTDQKREVSGAVERFIDILNWLGINFDEGPHMGGDFGPYIQSQRRQIYDQYAEKILTSGQAYRCFCSTERLEQMRQEQQANKMPPRYDRACRQLSADEIRQKLAMGERYVIRQKMLLEGDIVVTDELRGQIKFSCHDLDDQVLVKTDGMPTYQFANVVDDHLMEISHVIRGEEWIPSFPKNILLYQAFGWDHPKFIHMALSLNKGGGKLSKRQGDVAVEDYREKGYLPEALLNFSVLQGWHPRDDREILSLQEMIADFRYQDLGASPGIFDIEKLDYFNGLYIRKKSLSELADLCLPFFFDAGFIQPNGTSRYQVKKTGQEIDKVFLQAVVATVQERLKKLNEIGELTKFYFVDQPEYESDLLIWKKLSKEKIAENLNILLNQLEKLEDKEWRKGYLEQLIINYLKAKEEKVGDFLWPMRVALTGLQASPGPFEVAEVLGKITSIKRIRSAIEKIDSKN